MQYLEFENKEPYIVFCKGDIQKYTGAASYDTKWYRVKLPQPNTQLWLKTISNKTDICNCVVPIVRSKDTPNSQFFDLFYIMPNSSHIRHENTYEYNRKCISGVIPTIDQMLMGPGGHTVTLVLEVCEDKYPHKTLKKYKMKMTFYGTNSKLELLDD